MKKQSLSFQELVQFIRGLGYTVDVKFQTPLSGEKHKGYWYGRITRNSISGGFCEPNDGGSYWYINGRIAFDNKMSLFFGIPTDPGGI